MLCRTFKWCTNDSWGWICLCPVMWGCSLGEKDLEEENTEEGKAELGEVDADVGLGMNSGYKKAEYKFVPLHISHWYRALQLCSSPFFWGWESLPRLDFGSPGYVGVCYCPSSGLRCTVGGFYCYYLKFILIFLKSVFKRISLHQPCWYKSTLL